MIIRRALHFKHGSEKVKNGVINEVIGRGKNKHFYTQEWPGLPVSKLKR